MVHESGKVWETPGGAKLVMVYPRALGKDSRLAHYNMDGIYELSTKIRGSTVLLCVAASMQMA